MTSGELKYTLKDIGEDIHKRREQRGMSLADLAEAVGMHQSSVFRLECGKFWPSLKQYVIILNVLEAPMPPY